MPTKLYKAKRGNTGCSVTVNGKSLPHAAKPTEHADEFPTVQKFAWGDDSEASQYLAYCILHDYSPDFARYDEIRHAFHEDFIKQIRDDEWQITNVEMEEGIKFWTEKMRIAPLIEPGKVMRRLSIPAFIYERLIKRVRLSGGTVKPEQVDEALKRLGQIRRSPVETRSVIAEKAADYAPVLRPAK